MTFYVTLSSAFQEILCVLCLKHLVSTFVLFAKCNATPAITSRDSANHICLVFRKCLDCCEAMWSHAENERLK